MSKLEAEELKMIQKTDVINWYDTYLRPPSPKCRQLAILVWGCNTNMNEAVQMMEPLGKAIEDVDSFKRGSEFYSSLCWNKLWTKGVLHSIQFFLETAPLTANHRCKASNFSRASQVIIQKFGDFSQSAGCHLFRKKCSKLLWSLFFCTLKSWTILEFWNGRGPFSPLSPIDCCNLYFRGETVNECYPFFAGFLFTNFLWWNFVVSKLRSW